MYLTTVKELGTALLTKGTAFALTQTATQTNNSSVNDVLDSAQEVTASTADEVNRFVQYFNDNIPNLIAFGLKVIFAIVFYLIGSKVISVIRKVVGKSMERSNADVGVRQFVDSMLKFGLYALLIFMIATKFGVESSSVAAIIASAGLALQGSLSNFAGGILILLLRPFAVGDYIIVNSEGIEGTVKVIQIFYTKMTTIDNKTIVVPNSILTSNSLTNVTARPERQLDLKVGISYESDLKKAKEIVENLLLKDEDVIQDEEIKVFISELADSSVVIGLRAWVKTEAYWTTRWRILEEIKMSFDEEGIDIPYNQLTVHMANH